MTYPRLTVEEIKPLSSLAVSQRDLLEDAINDEPRLRNKPLAVYRILVTDEGTEKQLALVAPIAPNVKVGQAIEIRQMLSTLRTVSVGRGDLPPSATLSVALEIEAVNRSSAG